MVDEVDSRLKRVARGLARSELSVDDGEPFDLKPGDPSQRQSTRLLGLYSKAGLHTALDRYGLIDALADRGYPNLELVLETQDRDGSRFRVLSCDHEGAFPLVELRVRREFFPIAPDTDPLDVVFVEWFAMEAAGTAFTHHRPQLPGQRAPGLRLGREAHTLLVLMARRLGCDALVNVPERFHLAVLYRRAGYRSVSSGRDRTLDAVRAALSPLGFAPMAWAVDLETVKVADRSTRAEPYLYEAEPMILPVNTAARARLGWRNIVDATHHFDIRHPTGPAVQLDEALLLERLEHAKPEGLDTDQVRALLPILRR